MHSLPERRWLRHETPDWVRFDHEIFFITLCAQVRGSKHLVDAATAASLINSVVFRHDRGEWWSHLFLVMPDHVHGLFSFPEAGSGMKQALSNWKRWTARTLKLNWQEGFFDHRLRGREGFDEKAQYIRMNPVRAGLVTRPEDWPHVWSPR